MRLRRPRPLQLSAPDRIATAWLIAPGGVTRVARRRRRARWIGAAATLLALAAGSWWWLPRSPSAQQPAVASLALPPRIDAPFAPDRLRPLSSTDAVRWNAAVPLAAAGGEAARSFLVAGASGSDYARSLRCLAMAVYYEAGSEGDAGERAVAQVVLNRVRHPAYPKTVCGVVFDGAARGRSCQFTFACDGSLARVSSVAGYARATAVAAAALGGAVFAPVGWATHYHANYVVPYWAASLDKVASIGAHIFYRWQGGWGRAGAFARRYAGGEPLPLFAAGTPAEAPTPAPSDAAATIVDRPVLAPGTVTPGSASGRPADVSLGERRVLRPTEAAEPTP